MLWSQGVGLLDLSSWFHQELLAIGARQREEEGRRRNWKIPVVSGILVAMLSCFLPSPSSHPAPLLLSRFRFSEQSEQPSG